jgi:hypothetical protein
MMRHFSNVTSTPQCDSVIRKINALLLPRQKSAPNVRALDATPARETLMISILLSAVFPAGCALDLGRFRH